MPKLFQGHRYENELWAVAHNAAPLEPKIDNLDMPGSDRQLVRALVHDSIFRQALNGSEEKTFTVFPETAERLPHVYNALAKFGFVGVEIDRS